MLIHPCIRANYRKFCVCVHSLFKSRTRIPSSSKLYHLTAQNHKHYILEHMSNSLLVFIDSRPVRFLQDQRPMLVASNLDRHRKWLGQTLKIQLVRINFAVL